MISSGLLIGAAKAYGLPPALIAPELRLTRVAGSPDANLDWSSIDPHTIGQLHERHVLAARPLARKARGAFYTPPRVARLLAEEALPLAGSAHDELPEILDPGCGCGGLLVEALRYLCQRRGAVVSDAACRLRGLDRDLDSVILARLALIALAYNLGASNAELAAVARSVSRRIAPEDILDSDSLALADCVLMNPPYVRAASAPENRDRLRRKFRTASGAFDLHVPFVELAVRSVRPGGALGLLTSDKFLVADYGRKLRACLADELKLVRLIFLSDCAEAQTEALVSQVATVAVRQRPPCHHTVELHYPQSLGDLARLPAEPITLAQSHLLDSRWPTLRAGPPERRIVSHMTATPARPLGSVALVRGGVRGFDYEACCRELVEADGEPHEMPVVCPGNVRAYRAPSGHSVRLAGRRWKAPCLRRKPDRLSRKLWDLFGQPKLLVKGVCRRPTAALSSGQTALFVAVWGVWAEEDLLYPVLALLNSKPAAWLHYQQLYTARIPRGSLRVPLSWLAAFPIPAGDLSELRHLAHCREGATSDAERAQLQEQIDRASAEAYGLGDRELRIMDEAPLGDVQS